MNLHAINPLNAELNAICYLLALLGAHPILHVSRIRVNLHQLAAEVALSSVAGCFTGLFPFRSVLKEQAFGKF